jgi:hypothetical protein
MQLMEMLTLRQPGVRDQHLDHLGRAQARESGVDVPAFSSAGTILRAFASSGASI